MDFLLLFRLPNEVENYISEGERGLSSEESDNSSTEHDALAEELLFSPLARHQKGGY